MSCPWRAGGPDRAEVGVAASASARTSRPSRKVGSPKSSRPVDARAMSSMAVTSNGGVRCMRVPVAAARISLGDDVAVNRRRRPPARSVVAAHAPRRQRTDGEIVVQACAAGADRVRQEGSPRGDDVQSPRPCRAGDRRVDQTEPPRRSDPDEAAHRREVGEPDLALNPESGSPPQPVSRRSVPLTLPLDDVRTHESESGAGSSR